ncbi:hypothetical protein HUG12_09465 [Halorarum salinum]|uniref:DUF8139 domain-containing protein n=2 Tax=Halorarum salinum TaxID=2743089 RepID=A0A7D5QCW8_9EURY|nr:hypothetical protein HUG12_09465 [Halobaculum salinum]
MRRFETGDSVRIDIPDETDSDHELYHGRVGEVLEIIEDDAECHTGDERDSHLFVVKLENGDIGHFRWRDLRPDNRSQD